MVWGPEAGVPSERATPKDGVDALLNTVVNGGYCVGCGACVALRPDRLEMRLDDVGRFKPRLRETLVLEESGTTADPQSVCPFAEGADNEDTIGAAAFPNAPHADSQIGRWEALYAGYAAESDFRSNGSSGGMTTWIAAQLLKRGLVDAVIHVKPCPVAETGVLFQFAVSHDLSQLHDGAKTRYYPCEISDVMNYVRTNPQRYAIISLPCFSRAIRLLRQQDTQIGEHIKYQVAIVCGHLKSTAYAEYYGWAAGVPPQKLNYIDFRYKDPQAKSAKTYFIQVREHDGNYSVIENNSVYGTDWGLGFFKLKACDYCDDVLGETADITLGDAWLPKYSHDPLGTNIIVVRNAEIDSIIQEALESHQLVLDRVSSQLVAQSQSAGFRHRREGLAYRLSRVEKKGLWHPPKRVAAASGALTFRYQLIFQMREWLRDVSHCYFAEARQAGDLSIFIKKIKPIVTVYLFIQKTLDPVRFRNKFNNVFKRVFPK